MKKLLAIIFAILLTGTLFAAGSGESYESGQGYGRGSGAGGGRGRLADSAQAGNYGEDRFSEDISVFIETIKPEELNAAEKAALLLLREEEKLARDVYLKLYELWNYPIFRNIGESEAQHMESVGILLDRYNISDPVGEDDPGVFQSAELQKLYGELIEQGSESFAAALTTGATIEDLDIADLQAALEESDNQDIGIVFQNLMKGSRNHLRSFVSQLERLNLTYSPQYISQEYFEQILLKNREMAFIETTEYSFF